MTAQTSERVDSIEHLDHATVCEECGRPAEAYVDMHQCADYILCGACLSKEEKRFDRLISRFGVTGCDFCNRRFQKWPDLATARPL